MSKEKRIGCVVLALGVAALSLAVCMPCPAPSFPPSLSTADAIADVATGVDAAMPAEADAGTDAVAPVIDAGRAEVEPPYCFAHKKEAKAFCALAAKVCDP